MLLRIRPTLITRVCLVACLAAALAVALPCSAFAQEDSDGPGGTSIFPHPDDTRWWLSGQVNLIGQGHGTFTSPYKGPNSFRSASETALSHVWTIYTGVQ